MNAQPKPYYDKPRLPTADMGAKRANKPGIYHCPRCGERLSGPAREYQPCKVPR